MENKLFYIYAHVNKINSKVYIGQTCFENPNYRWRYGEGYIHSTYFYRAIQKYGWDNFEHLILIENLNGEQANLIERELILKYNTNNRNYGYNMTSGGMNGKTLSQETKDKIMLSKLGELNPNYGKKASDKTRVRQSEARKGKKFTLEHKLALSKASSGENNGMYGKHLSKEAKDKISQKSKMQICTQDTKVKLRESKLGSKNPNYGKSPSQETRIKLSNATKGKNNPRATPILQYDLDLNFIREYWGAKEVKNLFGYNVTSICLCCKGKRQYYKGYIWRYENNQEEINIMSGVEKHDQLCKELNKTYEQKNADYGNSFGDTFQKLGIISAVTRITDKYNRLVSLCTKSEEERKVKDESIRDTLMDMANYCMMTVMEMENEKDVLSE